MTRDDFQSKLRYHINRFVFDNGFAPTISELASITETNENEVRGGLQGLADNHALVLHPNTFDIWVAHPFALFPTLFWVKTTEKQWWAPCVWCSLGIATLTNVETEIHTKIQGETEPFILHIRENKLVEQDLFVHFPIPAKDLWNNVIHSCANMLVCKSKQDVDHWCNRHRVKKGEVLPIVKVWELARLWYGYYLDPDWKRKTPEVASAIFNKVGLTSDFWKLT